MAHLEFIIFVCMQLMVSINFNYNNHCYALKLHAASINCFAFLVFPQVYMSNMPVCVVDFFFLFYYKISPCFSRTY